MSFKTNLILGAMLFTGLTLTACSNTSGTGGASSQESTDQAVTSTTKGAEGHTHPANECTKTVSHTHPNGSGEHKHRYSCKPKMSNTADAHTHPANQCTRSISHSHPNGKGSHAHRYSCKSNNKSSSANGHFHPANSMTRSTRHNHPGGSKDHNHHYAK